MLSFQIDLSAHYCINHIHSTSYDSEQPQAYKGKDPAILP